MSKKNNDLKRMIKPIIRECINEILLEEGVLSGIISEVVKGTSGNLVTEQRLVHRQSPVDESERMRKKTKDTRNKLNEHRRKLMDSIGKDSYNGVDLFESVEPIRPQRATAAGSVDLGDPNDAGVDISSILGNSSKIWKAIK